ncbi:hypothetical protein F4801DRAFT_582484 [Xylaria longipes]|nr:hypothetical protein F4801DRAFT_582484 [Xylaria longipes]
MAFIKCIDNDENSGRFRGYGMDSLAELNNSIGTLKTKQTIHDDRDSKLSELYEGLSSSVKEIKQQINNPDITKQRIESCLRGDAPKTKQKVLAGAEGPEFDLNGNPGFSDQVSNWTARRANAIMLQESLQEVYYLVFLYLGHFLKNLFLVLSRIVQPSQALMPTLIAKYNISFLDAIGRPPRILPYEYFRSFKVLQAFIQHEFKDLPGSAWVDRGRYLILNSTNDRELNEHNLINAVVPGTTVAMSMLKQKRLMFWLNVFRNASNHPDSRSHSGWEQGSTINEAVAQQSVSQEGTVEEKTHLDDDIAMFKRVANQLVAELIIHGPSGKKFGKRCVAKSQIIIPNSKRIPDTWLKTQYDQIERLAQQRIRESNTGLTSQTSKGEFSRRCEVSII